jgi:3-hydroxyacyl-CoA dehydrogenase
VTISCSQLRGAVLLKLRSPPVNAISFAMLEELLGALRRANEQPDVRGVVITGDAEQFSAGADLGIFQGIRGDVDTLHVSQVFQEAFQAIEDSPKPVIAAVAGHVLGGALELAMACHFRLAAEGSRFSMPEVNLGINPGAGGTQRLPRLIGLEAALAMLLGGRPIDARQAIEWGLIDAICPAGELTETAVAFLEADHPVRKTASRGEKLADPTVNQAALAWAERQIATARPELIAPREILAAVRAGVDGGSINPGGHAGLAGEQADATIPAWPPGLTVGFLAEREAFRRCMASRATRNKIYVFCASRQTAKIPELESAAAARIAEAGVLGMGTMGAGIAQALIAAGLRVTACDESSSALEAGAARIRGSLDRRVAQGKLAAQKADAAWARLATTLDVQLLAGAELVVEAVFEDVAVKRAAIARLEAVCPAGTIIASNTSTINLDVLAEGMRHPERLVGLHFFHPAQQMPLVEVIRRRTTPPEVVAAALRLSKAIGKTPVLVENREGFVVNRLFVPYLVEAFWLLEEGVGPARIDRAMVDFGFAMGPFQLIDMSGLDILEKTHAIMRRAFPHFGDLPPLVGRLVEGGHLGQKTRAGVYRYEPRDHTPYPHDLTEQAVARAAEAVRASARRGGLKPAPLSQVSAHLGGEIECEQVVSRLMLRMVAEAFRLLEERIVRRAADVDVAMVLGTGLADFRGGVLRYAADLGLDRVLGELRRLAEQCGPRYTPCRMLEESACNPPLPPGEGRGEGKPR